MKENLKKILKKSKKLLHFKKMYDIIIDVVK